jgi:AbiV
MVTPKYLLQGSAYALEQCGLLLRDANLLYRSGSYASAVALAVFAQEELGRLAYYSTYEKRPSAESVSPLRISKIAVGITYGNKKLA